MHTIDTFRKSIFAPKTSLVPVPQGLGKRVDNKIVLNVGGVRFETYKTTLKSIPDTRLSWLSDTSGNSPEYDPSTGEFFFDRHSGMFHMILNYYRTGKLHIPMDVCGPAFEAELAYWGLDETQIEPCCWNTYRAHRDAQETLAEFEDSDDENESNDEEENEMRLRFGISDDFVEVKKTCWQKWRPRLWNFLDNPRASKISKIFAIVSVIFIVTSIVAFCLETNANFRYELYHQSHNSSEDKTVAETQRGSRPYLFLEVIEYACMIFFTIELVGRFIVCPSKLAFIKDSFNWIDVFSILPFYVARISAAISPEFESTTGYMFINALRSVRIFRILKLTRHFSGLKILGHTIRASAKELLLLFLVLIIGVLVFGVLIFYAEQIYEVDSNKFTDIPIGFYWAVVTMTTLGYGDFAPKTLFGYMVGAACAVCGLLMLSLPVPIIVSNFTLYYSHAQAKMKLPKKSKNFMANAANMLKECSIGTLTPPESASSLSGSLHSIHILERKDSNDSALGGSESMESPQSSKEQCKISVIYADETTGSPGLLKKPCLSTICIDSPAMTSRRKLSDIREDPSSPTQEEIDSDDAAEGLSRRPSRRVSRGQTASGSGGKRRSISVF
ncbi:hypothetical protein FSP39_004549 [Pinctada imbricata]|uniref:BTB domain-containing protein n=1 Tax=Pinctada imbricata TaxID=66713 RepID=A0AA88YPV1_PINIB|nr:hypothetical protein FSP39_004549 [Pinctada imbricata]